MLSHRYVDLLDCSELIENLKHYSLQMSGIAERNAENIRNSLDFISEKKSAPVKITQTNKISNIDKCLQLQNKALELSNRELGFSSITEKIYFIILFLVNTQNVHSTFEEEIQKTRKYRDYTNNVQQLKEILCELLAKLLCSLDRFLATTYTYEKHIVSTSILGIIRSIQYIANDDYCKGFLPDILDELLPVEENLKHNNDFKEILRYSYHLSIKVIELQMKENKNTAVQNLKSFLKIVKDLFFLFSENSEGFIIKKVDESLQNQILGSVVFRALHEGEHVALENIPEIFDLGFGVIVKEIHHSLVEFIESFTPDIESTIRSNCKTEAKFHS